MVRIMLKSKIHRATVTDANLEYEGSISVDKRLLQSADILPYEKVQVVDLSNGARIETYAIEADVDSGAVCINGAAARLVHKGDKVIIMAYANVDQREALTVKPKVIVVDGNNREKQVLQQIPSIEEC
jgi:aspartate 1-decarboxylase